MSEIDTAHDEFIEASVWHGSLDSAVEILAAHPEIATHSVHAAAVLGDATVVRRFIPRRAPLLAARLSWSRSARRVRPEGFEPPTFRSEVRIARKAHPMTAMDNR